MIRRILLQIALLVAATNAVDLPPFITPCKLKDPEFNACASKEANKVLGLLAPGLKEAGFPSLQPYQFKEASFKNDDVSVKFLDGTMEGLDTMVVDTITPHLDQGNFYFHSKLKKIKLTGKYDIQGKLLGEEIHSTGPVEAVLDDVDFDYYSYFDLVKKEDGKEYMKISKHPLKLTPTKVHYNFGNFYGDDAEKNKQFKEKLAANVNQFSKEMIPAIGEVIRDIMQKHVYGGLAEVVPFEQMFP